MEQMESWRCCSEYNARSIDELTRVIFDEQGDKDE